VVHVASGSWVHANQIGERSLDELSGLSTRSNDPTQVLARGAVLPDTLSVAFVGVTVQGNLARSRELMVLKAHREAVQPLMRGRL
jgi:hypothetical protein